MLVLAYTLYNRVEPRPANGSTGGFRELREVLA